MLAPARSNRLSCFPPGRKWRIQNHRAAIANAGGNLQKEKLKLIASAMSKKSSILSLLIVASMSLPCVAVGAFLREHSSRFDDWSQEYMAGIDPAHGVALAFASWWPLITLFWFLGLASFLAALAVVSWITHRTHWQILRALFITAFIVPTALAATIIIFDMLRDFRWGFYVMAFGECLTVISLLLGIWQIATRWKTRNAS